MGPGSELGVVLGLGVGSGLRSSTYIRLIHPGEHSCPLSLGTSEAERAKGKGGVGGGGGYAEEGSGAFAEG